MRFFMDGVVVLIFSTGKLFHRSSLTFEAKAPPLRSSLELLTAKLREQAIVIVVERGGVLHHRFADA